ncbi:heme-binding domain-containing protein [Pedobacter sp. N36a]|uniref:heme-binding domain-containing protein n=1 Tax=Pedobacter sp. N36a TaxID=2767996 RepID=UPI0016574BB1|nr:heme-binding domain-containing protein [Pedobacter sp. N36a]MBC8988463.1 heme-binding domain-containing protein [Pedobacter sp. N36a]
MFRKTLLTIGLLMVAIQFFRPEKNISTIPGPDAIDAHYTVPKEIGLLLRKSCYDCHSNNTVYPWYSNIQPFSWWQQSHVNDGKEELNFDEFNSYDVKKKKKKLNEVAEMIEKDKTPLNSYTLIHRTAILSAQDKDTLITWAKEFQKAIN